jgi:hypothetical protein
MQSFREVSLPSGAVLKLQAAPFSDARALYQALLDEIKSIDMPKQMDMGNLVKTALASCFSSKKIEACLWQCFKSCLYIGERGEFKIDKDTFEPLSAREDYVSVCVEVAQENVLPFLKGLYAAWSHALSMIASAQK